MMGHGDTISRELIRKRKTCDKVTVVRHQLKTHFNFLDGKFWIKSLELQKEVLTRVSVINFKLQRGVPNKNESEIFWDVKFLINSLKFEAEMIHFGKL